MANPKRTTNISVQVEYNPEYKVRTSKVAVQVEYNPEHKVRTSKIAIMIEYYTPVPYVRVLGPALQNM